MPDKRISTCCKREIAHKKDGTPYTHKCYALPEDPFVVPGQLPDNDPSAKRGAVDPFSSPTKPLGKSPFDAPKEDSPGPWFPASYDSECDTCGGSVSAGDEIRADGSGGWECQANCAPYDSADDRVTESPTHTHVYVWADDGIGHSGSFCGCGEEEPEPTRTEPPNLAVGGDHRKWCTRCKLLGHYAADCTTAVLEGGVVSVPELGATPHSYADAVDAIVQFPDQPNGAGGGTLVIPTDAFSDPTPPTPDVNVSGQPKARYEWHGKQNRGYLVKLPETGDFRRYKNGSAKGIARATTFNKAATDSTGLTDWAKRNVLIGASKRPDLVAKAHGMTHEDNRGELMSLVAELEETAGAKVSADIGTLIHELTERWDAGVLKSEDIPAAYRELIYLYDQTLKEAGLRPVPGLIERTTYIPEFGGVVGTLDRVYYHERSGRYLIGDVKTGKTLKYGMDEIETQEWIYAHGVNNAGVYDWNEDEWQPPRSYGDSVETGPWQVPEVSEEWGVVVHMPVQGDDAGKVMLIRADLQRGKRHAQVCHDVREERSNKPKPEPWTGEELAATERKTAAWEDAADWPYLFARVPSKESAALLWRQAYDAGVPPEEMEKLKELADARLTELAARPLSWADQAERVLTKEDAADVWERASAAGVRNEELDSLVAIMQRELS